MAASPKSILVIKPSSFGDVVHALPAVALLKQAWPEAALSWIINPEWAPLIRGNPHVQTIIPFPRAQFRGLSGGFRFLRWCRDTLAGLKPDLTVDLQGLLRSAWMGRASRAGCFVGMSNAREGARYFYDHVVPVPKMPYHAVRRCLETAGGAVRFLGGEVPPECDNALPFTLPPGKLTTGGEAVPPRYVLLHPFARGAGKSLGADQIEFLCRELAPCPVALVGRKGGSEVGPLPENSIDLLDRTDLDQLIWLIRHAAAVVTVDSGPSHLAAALRRPLVAVHTWSDPRRVGPYLDDALVWKNGRLMPMREMVRQNEAFFRERPRSLGTGDLAVIAEAAISLSGSSA